MKLSPKFRLNVFRTHPPSEQPKRKKFAGLSLLVIVGTIHVLLFTHQTFIGFRTIQNLALPVNFTDETGLLRSTLNQPKTIWTEVIDRNNDSGLVGRRPTNQSERLDNKATERATPVLAPQPRTKRILQPADALQIGSSLLPLNDESSLSRVVLATFSWLQLKPTPRIHFAVESQQDLVKLKTALRERYNVPYGSLNRVGSLSGVKFKEFGAYENFKAAKLPLVSDLIQRLIAVGTGHDSANGAQTVRFLWVNADIVLYQELIPIIDRVSHHGIQNDFCLYGKRDEVVPSVKVREAGDLEVLRRETEQRGVSSGSWYIDWISFGKSTWGFIPDFVIARNKFDNWLVANGRGITVDGSSVITATHQTHDYRHALTSHESQTSSADGRAPVVLLDNPGKRHNDAIAKKLDSESNQFKSWSMGRVSQACWGLRYMRSGKERHLCAKKRTGCNRKSVPGNWPPSCHVRND